MNARIASELETRRAELARICADPGVRRLELFGSGTRNASPRDVDFLVDPGERPPGPNMPRRISRSGSASKRCLQSPWTW